MRKTGLRLLFAFAIAASLTACGGGGGGGGSANNWDELVWDQGNWS